MLEPVRSRKAKSSKAARHPRISLGLVAAATILIASLAATAFAAGNALTLGSASNAALGEQVLVSSQGRTLYALSPETSKHLLCKSSECFKHWPPLTVKSSKTKLKSGSGVQGHLGILRRSNGSLQVTLRGLPLYRYAGDSAKGQANGEGIESFGGKWHAVTPSNNEAASKPVAPSPPPMSPEYPSGAPATPPSAPTTTTTQTTPPMTTTSPPPYAYPAY